MKLDSDGIDVQKSKVKSRASYISKRTPCWDFSLRSSISSDVKAQIKAVDELIQSHPANDKCIAYDPDATQAQEEELRKLFRRRNELVHQLAYCTRTW